MNYLLIPIMAILGRMCGAKWSPKWYPAELVWAIVIAIFTYYSPQQFIIFTVWLYIVMQLGHGRFYEMRGANISDSNPETIELYVQKIYKGDITKPIYSWLCMGAKGFLIGLPIGIIHAFLAALLVPFGYYLGFRIIKNGDIVEYIAWGFIGLILTVKL